MARRRGNSWQGALKTPEKYYRYSFPTEALAADWEREAKAAKKAGHPIPEPTVISNSRPTLKQFFEQQRDVIWPDHLPRNVESNQRACLAVLGGDILIQQLTLRRLNEFVSDLLRKGNKPSTINTRLSHLNVLLQHARGLDLVDEVPRMPWRQHTTDNSRMRFLTENEEEALLKLLRHWGFDLEADLTEALIDTGCRPSELIHAESRGEPIKWSEVSVSAGGEAPDVNDPATGEARAVISLLRTKTGDYRVIPLTDRAKRSFLRSKQRGDPRPFGRIRADDISACIRRAADHLGMHDVVLYTMRHTCASRLVQRGADLYRVMKWMGHTNIKTTQRYAKLTPSDIFGLGELL